MSNKFIIFSKTVSYIINGAPSIGNSAPKVNLDKLLISWGLLQGQYLINGKIKKTKLACFHQRFDIIRLIAEYSGYFTMLLFFPVWVYFFTNEYYWPQKYLYSCGIPTLITLYIYAFYFLPHFFSFTFIFHGICYYFCLRFDECN